MGNIFSSNKTSNTGKRNIKLCEKRYGYNLNDLHSYIYKINLPIKPKYINYILENKNNDNIENKNNDNIKNINNVENINKNDSLDNIVDIYHIYDKDNINNSNNIYKNKLKINKNKNKNKYTDKYIHISYDKNYEYDKNINNINTNGNIVNYFEQGNILNKNIENKINDDVKINKTYINLCLNYYNNLNTCVLKKYDKNLQNRKYKYTRLHTCKPHYILFSRCIKYRDRKIMNRITKIELNYFNNLKDISKSDYLNEFISNIKYHEYLISTLYDGVEKIKLLKELEELKERYNNILKENDPMNTILHSKNTKNKMTNIIKKHVLLNI